jgi:hypothetical protein
MLKKLPDIRNRVTKNTNNNFIFKKCIFDTISGIRQQKRTVKQFPEQS